MGTITDETQLYTLAGTYLGCSVLAWILVSVFLDPLSRYCWLYQNEDTIVVLFIYPCLQKVSLPTNILYFLDLGRMSLNEQTPVE